MDTVHTFPGLEPVLTTSDLAAHLGVPVQTIHDLRHAHRGPRGFRVGREMRYRLSEVQHWVATLESQHRTALVAEGDSLRDHRETGETEPEGQAPAAQRCDWVRR